MQESRAVVVGERIDPTTVAVEVVAEERRFEGNEGEGLGHDATRKMLRYFGGGGGGGGRCEREEWKRGGQ